LLAANAAAGGLAGALALAIVYPFELLTIRMAADVGGGSMKTTTATTTTTTPPRQWQYGASPLEAARRAVARDGPRGLYRGFGVAVASAACYKALYFGLHDWVKVYLFDGRYDDDRAPLSSPSPSPSSFIRTVLERLSIASGTTVLAATITHPLDVVRKRLVVDLKGELYGGTFAGCVRGIWRREGLRGFLRFLPQDALLRSGAGTILVTYDMLLSTSSVVGDDRGGGRGGGAGGAAAAATETT
jgi:solute carrier family 25 protein 44